MNTDFTKLTGPELVSAFNALVRESEALGATSIPKQVKRFATHKAGVDRCVFLHNQVWALKKAAEIKPVADAVAKAETAQTAKAKTAAKAPAKKPPAAREASNGTGHPLKWYTDTYNSLVPEAVKLGVKAKHHTSLFESRAKAEVQLAKLKAAIEAAKQSAGRA
jgi:hypothetical protein